MPFLLHLSFYSAIFVYANFRPIQSLISKLPFSFFPTAALETYKYLHSKINRSLQFRRGENCTLNIFCLMGITQTQEGLRVSDRGLCGYLYTSSMSHGRGITLAMALLSPLNSSTGYHPSLSVSVLKTSLSPFILIHKVLGEGFKIFSVPDVSE